MKTKLRLQISATQFILSLVLVCAVMCSPCSQAQETDEETVDAPAASEDTRFELDEIVVTASKTEDPLEKVSRNVTVITADDIAEAPSNNIVDLLGREVGIQVRSLQGNDRQAVVDMRGMGATAASNVVVLVDGIRLNSPDLSGPDLSAISLDQIERIEVVRGSGAVVYGDGAVGGVVNIVTKKGLFGREIRASASYGSYDTKDAWASFSGDYKDLNYSFNGAVYDTDGYRDNGALQKRDISGMLGYALGDYLTLNLGGSHHSDEYGLPGPVSIDDVNSASERVKTVYPDDYGETEGNRVSFGVEIETDGFGYLKTVRAYRTRANDFIIGYNPLIAEADQFSNIDETSKSFQMTWDKSYSLFSRSHGILLGIDHYFTDYVREEAPNGPRQNSRTDSLGFFISNQLSLTQKTDFQLGYRGNRHDGRFRTDQLMAYPDGKRWVNGEEETKSWYNNAWDAGLNYSHSDQVNLIASCATSFRIPNVDEMAESDDDLHPQKGFHADAGGRFKFLDRLELTFTLFNLIVEDEIYYSEINRNYDDNTVRRGLELDFKYRLTASVFTWGNYTYTHARFEEKDTVVPLVPTHMASTGIEWRILEPLAILFTGTFVGERYDGNDIDNDAYEKLDAYQVLDTRVNYTYKSFKFFAGMNNMLDEMYSGVAYSESYYPMPGRNAYAGVTWSL